MAVKGEPPCGSFSNKQPLMSKTIYLEGKNMKNSLLEFSLMEFSSYFMMVVFQWIIVDKIFLFVGGVLKRCFHQSSSRCSFRHFDKLSVMLLKMCLSLIGRYLVG